VVEIGRDIDKSWSVDMSGRNREEMMRDIDKS